MQYFEEFIDDLKSFDFNGRMNRAMYWRYAFLGYLLMIGIFFVLGILGMDGKSMASLVNTVYAILFLPFNVRRLHDLNRNGLWLLLTLVPIVNFFFFICLCFVKGTNGPNQYGPDPLAK